MGQDHNAAVTQNLLHMGTAPDEWQACPFEMHVDDAGKSYPVTVFPSGYSPAPTLYEGQDTCGLCAHRIKNVYWLQNDKRRWTLPVGSECVTHFTPAGLNGEEVAEGFEREFAMRTLAWVFQVKAAGQGRTGQDYHLYRAAYDLHERAGLNDPLAVVRRNKLLMKKMITRWKKAAEVRAGCKMPMLVPRPPEEWLREGK